MVSQISFARLVASKARRIPGTSAPVATPEKDAEAHTIPLPTKLELADTDIGAELENPVLFCTVLWVTGVVWNCPPTNL